MAKLIQRRYLDPAKGRCKVVIPRHLVPKGLTYIHVMCNLTKNGFNNNIIVPYFSLEITIYRLAKVIRFYDLLNVINIDFIVSLVPQAFVQILILKYYSITPDMLIWTPSGPV